jgi:hypothetical protein
MLTHWPLHSLKPESQTMPQLEFTHFALPLAGASQLMPQPPQLVGSLFVSMQASPHLVKPLSQAIPQVPEVQVALPWTGSEHCVSQLPQ